MPLREGLVFVFTSGEWAPFFFFHLLLRLLGPKCSEFHGDSNIPPPPPPQERPRRERKDAGAVRGRWAPPPMEGEGPKGRAANGDRPIGAARCRREQYTKGHMPNHPPRRRRGRWAPELPPPACLTPQSSVPPSSPLGHTSLSAGSPKRSGLCGRSTDLRTVSTSTIRPFRLLPPALCPRRAVVISSPVDSAAPVGAQTAKDLPVQVADRTTTTTKL